MRNALHAMLDRLVRTGDLIVTDPSGQARRHGDGTGDPVRVRITEWRAWAALTLRPDPALGEAYMDGALIIEQGDIAALLDLLLRHVHPADLPLGRISWKMRQALRRIAPRNTAPRARANVVHHYDRSNALYALFLDQDWQYSCAYFPRPDTSLNEAQRAKVRHIAAKLLLRPNQSILDIGCGWGGTALRLARLGGGEVTGVTLSDQQLALARARAAQSGLDERVRFELTDYRALTGPYDRIVSVGMFEHVGLAEHDAFFAKIRDLLAPDGVMLLHAIGRPDGPSRTSPWIEKYIFPGGYIPALSEVTAAIERQRLRVTDIEILRLHYAETLKAWRERFLSHAEEVDRLFDARFRRMWEFYLAACEMAFRHQGMFVFQIQLARDQKAVPITRDYIAAAERRLARIDRGEIRPAPYQAPSARSSAARSAGSPSARAPEPRSGGASAASR